METGVKEPRFRPDMTMKEALDVNFEIIAAVFEYFNFRACIWCDCDKEQCSTTIANHCAFYDVDQGIFLRTLEAAVSGGCWQNM